MISDDGRSGTSWRDFRDATSTEEGGPRDLFQEAVQELLLEHTRFPNYQCRQYVDRVLERGHLSWVQPSSDYTEGAVLIPISRLVEFVRSVSELRDRLLQQPAASMLDGLGVVPEGQVFEIDYRSDHHRGDRILDSD